MSVGSIKDWVRAFVILIIGAAIGFLCSDVFSEFIENNLRAQIKELNQQAAPLLEKEGRIKVMEKTLMIHYKLSWYESHYYAIIMDDFSQKYGIPWEIYAAVIRIESNFDPTLLSKGGARGLTQVLENTGKEIAERIGIGWEPKKTLWNEIPNMVIGFTYLSEAIKERGLEDGIRTYIGGPGFDKGHKLVGDYRTTVRWEFDRLVFIHHGVKNGGELPDSTIKIAGMGNDNQQP